MRFRSVPSLALAALTALAIPAAPTHAASLAGITLPDKADAGGQSLVLNGLALRTKFFIKVYVGGLYLTHKEHDAGKVFAEDAARRQVLSFLYSVKAGQMCDAWKDGLAANTPHASAEVKKNFDTLCSWMEDIPKGMTLTLTYVPGQGTAVEVNNKPKGTLPGKPTADAVLATWIGPKPDPGADFTMGVLGLSVGGGPPLHRKRRSAIGNAPLGRDERRNYLPAEKKRRRSIAICQYA